MPRIKLVIGIAAGILVVLLIAGWLLLDVNQYRGLIQAQLEQQLQRKVTLGTMSLGLLPLRLQVESPEISDDPAFGAQAPFVRAENLDVRIGLMSLLRGNVNVQSVELDRPAVELVRNKNGSWNFETIGAADEPQRSQSPSDSGGRSIVLDRLAIRDGQIAITDHQNAQPRTVYDHIDFTLLDYAEGRPFTLDLAARIAEGQEIRLEGEGGPAVEGNAAATPFRGSLTVDSVGLANIPKFLNSEGMSGLEGSVSGESQIANQADSLTAAGRLTLDGARFNNVDVGYPIRIDYELNANPTAGLVTIKNGSISLGPTPLSLTGSVNTNAIPTNIDLNLKSGDVSVEEVARLASAFGLAFGASTKVTGQLGVNVAAKGPVANPALNGTITGRDLNISGADIPQPVQVKSLDLTLTPTEIRSNEFAATSGETTALGRFGVRQYRSNSPIVNVGLKAPNATLPEIQSIAKAYGITGIDQIKGEGALNLDLQAAGPAKSLTGADVMRALNGSLNLNFSPLQMMGFDVAGELAKIAGFTSAEKGFSDLLRLTGNIVVKNGVAQTDDLLAQLAIGHVAGVGTANLADDSLNLKLSAVLSKAFTEKVGGNRVGGFLTTALANSEGELVIPAIVTGTLKQPKFSPDVRAVAQMQRQKLLPSFDNPRAAISGILGSFRREAQPQVAAKDGETTEEAAPAPAPKPVETVKGILGGLFGRRTGSALSGTSWQWQKTTMPDGASIVPRSPEKFAMSFGNDGRMTSGTDCNKVSGAYAVDGSRLSFSSLIATKMFCEGSQETLYISGLEAAATFAVSGNALTITLKNGGVMTFSKR